MTRDLRKYSRQTTTRLIIGGIVLIFVIGDGLIYLIYGTEAAITGLICLGAGLMPVLLILAIFQFLDWLVKKAERE
ncbi:MAG: hypothetical protein MUO76_24605 [Anaerolineaceae bacterium]|jgi:hypothetical protein|nr:hypothetical protein [Anaerolineaceae bacterium]